MKEKQKVLYVFGGEKASGAEIVIERLMSYNLKAVEPHLFVSPGKFADSLVQASKPYPVTVVERLRKLNRSSTGKFAFYLEAIKNYLFISRQVLTYVRRHNIQTVHANTVVPASYLLPAIVFSKAAGKKIRWLWSDHDLTYFAKLDSVLSKRCVAQYNKTLVVSEAVKKKYGHNGSVQVLYNGLDLSVFKADALPRQAFRQEHNIDGSTIVFGMAAFISPRKGQLHLIHTFKELAASFSNILLVLAGRFADDSPGYSEEVKSAIKDSPRISYIGQVSDMIAFYNGCDIIVNNSNKAESEPLGTTIYEAMACEKVVIASNTGGTPEIITNGVDGFLFEAENVAELKQQMRSVIENHHSFDKVRTLARQKVESKFNIQTMVRNYNKILQSIQ